MSKLWLFSYGTLSDPEYIQLLLKRLPEYREAYLPDYELQTHPLNGYLFAKPCIGKKVSGFLFEISSKEIELIDLWEEVPLYQREIKWVTLNNGKTQKAFVFTQKNTTGLSLGKRISKSRQEIVQEITDFLTSLQESD